MHKVFIFENISEEVFVKKMFSFMCEQAITSYLPTQKSFMQFYSSFR